MPKAGILIIDDDKAFAEMLSEFFRGHKYTVAVASTLEEVHQKFQQIRPGVVLLDYSMPVLSGDKMISLLQSLDPMIRVIVITGFPESEVEERFKGLGYFAFFRKGDLELANLKIKVEEALQQ